MEQLGEAIASSEQDTTARQAEISAHEQEITDKNVQIEKIRTNAAGAKDRIDAIHAQIAGLVEKQQALERVSGEQRALLKGKNEEKEAATRETAKLTEKRTSLNEECDRILAALWEQYTLTRTEAIATAQPIPDRAAADRQLAEYKSKIKALGTVNLAAIDEYAEVSERYEFLSGQLKDVLKSKAELTRLIEELTESMKRIFTENFEKINRSFQTVFVELFGGGKAELVLCDPENVLECGIDIKVAPPGKLINSLSLLSGGEQAFVAIAIYFAILKVHPSPFCLLDEIEAALDDVNVVKYAQYLRKFTNTTQFITITHRRGTMEEADVLYGVTMQEKGISRLLRMDAGEGARLAEAK